jgi:phospholipid/cholesterol/gamma-HCH transport system permease protein
MRAESDAVHVSSHGMIGWIGERAIAGYGYLASLATLSSQAFLDFVTPEHYGRRESFRIIARQILFTGVDALPVTSVIALLLGILIITQAGTQLPRLGAGGLVGTIIVVVVVRELGPLLTAFVVIGRSGTAIATELGNMSVNRELVALRLMGIPVSRFVVMPRMAGMIMSMICLTLYFDVVAIGGGYLVANVQLAVPFYAFADGILHALSLTDVLLTAVKGTTFGAAVASVCCHHGLSVRSSFTEVPQQTTKAMINSLVLCLLLDVCITIPVYL